MCVCTSANLQELVLAFYHVGLRNQSKIMRLDGKNIYLLNRPLLLFYSFYDFIVLIYLIL